MKVVGVSSTQGMEIVKSHQDLHHRKSFEKTQLGRLPPEILLHILRYIVPDCKDCFLQRDLLRLASVCKRLNQLTKLADFYREVKLSDECCPLPTPQVMGEILRRSGSKLKKIVCNFKCRDLLFVAVLQCRDTVQEINVTGTRFNRKCFGLSFGLKSGLRFHFDSDTCLNYQFLNFFFV